MSEGIDAIAEKIGKQLNLSQNIPFARQILRLAQGSADQDAFVAATRMFGNFDNEVLIDVFNTSKLVDSSVLVPTKSQNPEDSQRDEPAESEDPSTEAEDLEIDRLWYNDDQPEPDSYISESDMMKTRKRKFEQDGEDKNVRIFVNHNVKPAFLAKNQELGESTLQKGPISIFRNPDGRMAEAAKLGSPLVRLRRSQRERRKQAAEATSNTGTVIGKIAGDGLVQASNKKSGATSEYLTRDQILAQRTSLPAFAARDQLMKIIRENQVIVVVGETGSGKTTQLPQFLLEEGYANGSDGIIACTQPRRVAAMSVAQRVSVERGTPLGNEVGYVIRFEEKVSKNTKIKFMTDGILLREALTQPYLDKYSCIIIDEAHERSLSNDILFGLFKRILAHRLDLKLIITSATLNADRFSQFFGGALQFTIPGRTFPVNIHNVKAPVDDYVSACVKQVITIHLTSGPGDILVFMTGQEDIEATVEEIHAKLALLTDPAPLEVLPMYSQLPADMQARIFLRAKEGTRKVIVSTNIAETSLTVDGIKYVVDSGFTKVKVYKANMGMDTLQVAPVSLATAAQRAGRAGRTSEGYAYRMYTKYAEETEMYDQNIPEIKRTNLSNTLLLLKSLNVDDVYDFDFLDPPDTESVSSSLYDLWALGALDSNGALTKLGSDLAKFPMDPYMARLVLASVENNCSEEMATIVAMLSVPNVFHRSNERAKESDRAREKFFVPESDHLTLMNVYNQWRLHNSSPKWSTQSFVHDKVLQRAQSVRSQLVSLIQSVLKAKITSSGSDWDVIRRCICMGYFHQASRARGLQKYIGLRSNVTMQVHPTSSLYGTGHLPDYVVYHELIMTSQQYMTTVTSVDPDWLLEDGSIFYYREDEQASVEEQQVLPTAKPDTSASFKPKFVSRAARTGKTNAPRRAFRGV